VTIPRWNIWRSVTIFVWCLAFMGVMLLPRTDGTPAPDWMWTAWFCYLGGMLMGALLMFMVYMPEKGEP
jgi:membrane associated rhomboid family serine protease